MRRENYNMNHDERQPQPTRFSHMHCHVTSTQTLTLLAQSPCPSPFNSPRGSRGAPRSRTFPCFVGDLDSASRNQSPLTVPPSRSIASSPSRWRTPPGSPSISLPTSRAPQHAQSNSSRLSRPPRQSLRTVSSETRCAGNFSPWLMI
jgi:hypothetical protein